MVILFGSSVLLSHFDEYSVNRYSASVVQIDVETARAVQVIIDQIMGVAGRHAIEECQLTGYRLYFI